MLDRRIWQQDLSRQAKALGVRDNETGKHSQRVTAWTVHLSRVMGIPEEQIMHVRRGALLHDIGKIGVPDRILFKPGKLDDDEWVLMREHVNFGINILGEISHLHLAIAIPQCHHEKWDGSGYPRGLSGEQIPLEARIFAIVDVWDALTNDRPYRQALSDAEAIAIIEQGSGSHFDPHVVETFLKELPALNALKRSG
jgi:putative nucleotidyltransferase with HDIG domain